MIKNENDIRTLKDALTEDTIETEHVEMKFQTIEGLQVTIDMFLRNLLMKLQFILTHKL